MSSEVDYQPPDKKVYIDYGQGYIGVDGFPVDLQRRKFSSEGNK